MPGSVYRSDLASPSISLHMLFPIRVASFESNVEFEPCAFGTVRRDAASQIYLLQRGLARRQIQVPLDDVGLIDRSSNNDLVSLQLQRVMLYTYLRLK